MSGKDTPLVLAASYDSVPDAAADHDAVKALYYSVAAWRRFDAVPDR